MSLFETYRVSCTARVAVSLQRRPGNALNIEIGQGPDRCMDKRPEHWPESMSASRWRSSGGSALVLGACSQVCPRLCAHAAGESCYWCTR